MQQRGDLMRELEALEEHYRARGTVVSALLGRVKANLSLGDDERRLVEHYRKDLMKEAVTS